MQNNILWTFTEYPNSIYKMHPIVLVGIIIGTSLAFAHNPEWKTYARGGDKKVLNRINDILSLNNPDRDMILNTLDALLIDAKTRKAYSS